MPTITITLDTGDGQFVYDTLDRIPLRGPNEKASGLRVQAALASAQPDPEPDESSGDLSAESAQEAQDPT